MKVRIVALIALLCMCFQVPEAFEIMKRGIMWAVK